jgi:hypothetical protein
MLRTIGMRDKRRSPIRTKVRPARPAARNPTRVRKASVISRPRPGTLNGRYVSGL